MIRREILQLKPSRIELRKIPNDLFIDSVKPQTFTDLIVTRALFERDYDPESTKAITIFRNFTHLEKDRAFVVMADIDSYMYEMVESDVDAPKPPFLRIL